MVACLYLVPTPLDFGCTPLAPLEDVMPLGTLTVAAGISHWIGENAKSTRAFLGRVNAVVALSVPVQSQSIETLPRAAHKKGDHLSDPASDKAMQLLLAPALAGHPMGLVSEAGMPAIADPGASVVRAAHGLGIQVRPLTGPVSLMLALAASGLNGQLFAFVGYLPVAADDRNKRIMQLQSMALQTGQTQLVIETPYRNQALLGALVNTLNPSMRLAVMAGATLAQECVHSASVGQWRQKPPALPLDLPAVFAFGPG
jgi:16S rRNA (cytidine1402-2'-O)-methyltransferase